MSLLGLFDIGKSAIFASQQAMNVVSNNIANVNTPGYSRHEAILEVATPVRIKGGYLGRGVNSSGIRRHYDKFLHLQIIGQNQSYGRSYSLDQGLSNIEQVFNEAQNLGLANYLRDYFNAWQDVTTNPEGQPERTALLQKANSLIQTAQQMESSILDTLKYINNDIANVTTEINSTTTQIADLNVKIAQLEAGLSNESASFLRDERDRQLNKLAELIDYSWFEDSSGQVSVFVGGKILIESANTFTLTSQLDIDGHSNVYLDGENITTSFSNGKLGGYIAVRSDIEDTPLHDLRKLVASIIQETNILHSTGYGLDSSTGNDFYDALQVSSTDYSAAAYVSSSVVTDRSALTLDEYTIVFSDASNYEVRNRRTGIPVTSGVYTAGGNIDFQGIRVVIDGAPVANDSFLVSPLTKAITNFNVAITDTNKVAAASASANLPGDNTMAASIAGLAQANISNLDNATFEDHYEGIVSNIGIMTKAAEDSLNYDDNLRFELERKRDAVSGVSLDEEAANLIRFQRMYEAGARLLQVTDELLETIINL